MAVVCTRGGDKTSRVLYIYIFIYFFFLFFDRNSYDEANIHSHFSNGADTHPPEYTGSL